MCPGFPAPRRTPWKDVSPAGRTHLSPEGNVESGRSSGGVEPLDFVMAESAARRADGVEPSDQTAQSAGMGSRGAEAGGDGAIRRASSRSVH